MSLTKGTQEGLDWPCRALEAMALCAVAMGIPHCSCLPVVRPELCGSSRVILALGGSAGGETCFLRPGSPMETGQRTLNPSCSV